jgi:hypothetical protein
MRRLTAVDFMKQVLAEPPASGLPAPLRQRLEEVAMVTTGARVRELAVAFAEAADG